MKFRYLFIPDDGSDVVGTDDKATALMAADGVGENGFDYVIDTELGTELINNASLPIKEQTTFVIAHNPDVD